jgi:dTDP-glucose 4,6-dehydratase
MAVPRVASADLDRLIDATGDAQWRSFRGARFFITGGTGYVGAWLLELLLHSHDRLRLDLQVAVLTRAPDGFRSRLPHLAEHPAVQVVAGDLSCLRELSTRFDHGVHAGGDATPTKGSIATFDGLLEGTRTFCEFASRSGCQRLLNMSSGAVYGRQPWSTQRLSEHHASGPFEGEAGAYGLGKLASEWLANELGHAAGVAVVHARLFAMLGPYIPLQQRFAAGQFFADAVAGRPIRVNSQGTAQRSYLYAGDVAVWLLTLLLRGEAGQAYNVGSEQPISILALAEQIAELAGGRVEVAGPLGAAAAPTVYVPDTQRARQQLGLQPLTDWSSCLRSSWSWVQALYAVNPSVAAPREAGKKF